MNEVTTKKANIKTGLLIGVAASAILALAAFLIAHFAITQEKLGFAPILLMFMVFFFALAVDFGIFALIAKSTLYFVFCGGAAWVGLAFLLFTLIAYIPWYITILVLLVLAFVVFVLVFAFRAKTLEIDYSSNDPQRKPYAVRQAEAEGKRRQQLEEEKNKPLPEVKSFKE